MGRRLFISGFLVALAAFGRAEPLKIARDVWLLPGSFTPGSQPDGNSVVFEAPEGLVIVDTGRHESHTKSLVEFAASRKTGVAAIINTHWHLDHIGGNARIRKQFPDVRVYATGTLEDALDGFLATYRAQLVELIPKTADSELQIRYRNELALIDSGSLLGPDEVVERTGRKQIAGRSFEVFVAEHAATEADLWVIDRRSGVLVAGDLITFPVPFLDTACPAGLKDAMTRLAGERFRIMVPGHGAPMNREAFEQYRTAFDGLLTCADSTLPADSCTAKWLEGLGEMIPESQHELTQGLMSYYIGNHLRGDPARIGRLCGS